MFVDSLSFGAPLFAPGLVLQHIILRKWRPSLLRRRPVLPSVVTLLCLIAQTTVFWMIKPLTFYVAPGVFLPALLATVVVLPVTTVAFGYWKPGSRNESIGNAQL